MSKLEIIKLWQFPSGRYIPCGLNFWDKLWWKFMPGEIINVRWPEEQPADPNYHYRPYLEQHVGRQGRDWNWGMCNTDATNNRITIKIRRQHASHALILAMRWA